MHPIQLLRKKDPTLRHALARRPGAINWEEFDALEERRQAAQSNLEECRRLRRVNAERAGAAKRGGNTTEFDALVKEGLALNEHMDDIESMAAHLDERQQAWVRLIPNAPADSVPDGTDEKHNRLVETVGGVPTRKTAPDHVSIAKHFGGINTEAGAMLAKSRFAVMGGQVARLHRALIQMMLDLHGEAGYEEVNVPYLVKGQTLFGTGQLPKFEEDLFKTQDDLYLIPTAEVPVTNLVAGQVLVPSDLPLAWCAHTPCFRREAGSAGRDMYGLIRQHQFEKVELVRIEHPDNSEQALMTHILGGAKRVMDALDVPYRVVELCTGDLGFSAQRTFDIEVWMPAFQTYREISSCSNMGDFQARRMNVKLKDGKTTVVPHTLNGSGVAVGRALIAVLENHFDPETGRLHLPERLRPYLGGAAYWQGRP